MKFRYILLSIFASYASRAICMENPNLQQQFGCELHNEQPKKENDNMDEKDYLSLLHYELIVIIINDLIKTTLHEIESQSNFVDIKYNCDYDQKGYKQEYLLKVSELKQDYGFLKGKIYIALITLSKLINNLKINRSFYDILLKWYNKFCILQIIAKSFASEEYNWEPEEKAEKLNDIFSALYVDSDRRKPFIEQAGKILKLIISGVNINQKFTDQDKSLLLYAASINDDIMIKILLAYGADVNIKDFNQVTPLMEAVNHGNVIARNILLKNDAQVYSLNADEESVLECATKYFLKKYRPTKDQKEMLQFIFDIAKRYEKIITNSNRKESSKE